VIAVLKIGGSVLTGIDGYREAARFVAARRAVEPGTKLVVVVSAEFGQTDALLDLAHSFDTAPDPVQIDLLWSTGELRSVALLAMAVRAEGIRVAAANIHQTGLLRDSTGRTSLLSLTLRHLIEAHEVVVVPGFLACGAANVVVSLGRGGSDLSAVLIAAGLGAQRCELIKDVDGYYSTNPKLTPGATHLPHIDFDRSLAMADAGCGLVQRDAIEAARAHALPIVVRSMRADRNTVLSQRS
jgi:aspartate kinase